MIILRFRILAVAAVLAGPACNGAPDSGKAPAKTEAKTTDTKSPEAKAPEAKAPEAKAPEAKAAAADDGPDPCALATRERAATALKSPVAEGVRSGNACKWKAETGPGSVTIEITPTKGAEVYDHELGLLGSDATLSGIGDRAFRSGMIIGVHKDERYIAIGVAPNIGQGPMAKPPEAEAFARDVIAALP